MMLHTGTFTVPRTVDEVFELLATPERFAPLMPDFESMTVQDPTHFTLRVLIQLGPMRGHAALAMELADVQRPKSVIYRGSAVIAGSKLRLDLEFGLTPVGATTAVLWRGELGLTGAVAFMGDDIVQTMGHQNFERMAEQLRSHLGGSRSESTEKAAPRASSETPDFEI
jgi:carbon monoxide dehydrogenase subunit G